MDYEKLGLFYLGKRHDPETQRTGDEPILYDSRHLLTHGVIVGMTGSGKTGLSIDLLEEAAIDGIPVLAIDPKGDLGNLLLTFPELRPADFEPFVDAEDAARRGLSPAQRAAEVAEATRAGLAASGIDGARIARFRASAEVRVYTPGSEAGVPLSIVRSFAPSPGEDEEGRRERIAATATSLLGLVGREADAATSRDHVLLSAILAHAAREGRTLDLPALVSAVQRPPFETVGVLALESFYPERERFELVMALNNLLASPTFASWMAGEPLDIARMLRTEQGKPRIAIVNIAHLEESQRMFVVALLLEHVLAWTRAQSGTSSLRAIVYMDEIFGYFPPVANPPSKRPLLTLLKQARAFGVGVLLATQNPVDLDYKGLSNAGTWFLGRLQTERDQQRVLDGLEGVATSQGAAFDRAGMARALAGLRPRHFILRDAHEKAPIVFETRYAMSYLRGPMTRAELRRFRETQPAATAPVTAPAPGAAPGAVPAPAPAPAPVPAPVPASVPASAQPPVALAGDIPVCHLPLRRELPPGHSLLYRPTVLGLARVAMSDRKADVDLVEALACLTPLVDDPVGAHWEHAVYVVLETTELPGRALAGAGYGRVPAIATTAKRYARFGKDLLAHLAVTRRLELYRSEHTGLVSRPGEDGPTFRARLAHAAREQRDAEVLALRRKFEPKVARIDEKIRRAHAAIARERAEADEASTAAAFSIGSAVLTALGGRGLTASKLGRAATATRSAQRRSRAGRDVETAEAQLAALLEERKGLEGDFAAEVAALDATTGVGEVLTPLLVKPKKTGIQLVHVTLAWEPFAVGPSGGGSLFA